jgi:hypothetical protein
VPVLGISSSGYSRYLRTFLPVLSFAGDSPRRWRKVLSVIIFFGIKERIYQVLVDLGGFVEEGVVDWSECISRTVGEGEEREEAPARSSSSASSKIWRL